MHKGAEAQGSCCSRPVQFASVGLLGRAVVGDEARGLDRQAAGGPRSGRLQVPAEEPCGLESSCRLFNGAKVWSLIVCSRQAGLFALIAPSILWLTLSLQSSASNLQVIPIHPQGLTQILTLE